MMECNATIILVDVLLDCCTRRTKYHVLQTFDLQRHESRFGLHASSEMLHSLQYRIQIQTHIQIQLTTYSRNLEKVLGTRDYEFV